MSTEKPNDFADVNPLKDNVIKREYAQPIQADSAEPIPTPQFQRPSFQKESESSGESKSRPSSSEPVNPAMNEAPTGEKKVAAEAMAKNALDVYAKLKSGVGGLVGINENKMLQLVASGNLDPSLPVPIDENTTVPVMKYVQAYNGSVKDVFVVSPEWRAEVEPILARVLAKRGMGLTDEQQLMYLFGADIVATTFVAYKLIKTNNEMLAMWVAQSGGVMPNKDGSSNGNASNTPPTKPPKGGGGQGGSYTPPPPPQPTPSQPTPPPPTQQFKTTEPQNPQGQDLKGMDNDGFIEPEEAEAVYQEIEVVESKTNDTFSTVNFVETNNIQGFGDPEMLAELDLKAKEFNNNTEQ